MYLRLQTFLLTGLLEADSRDDFFPDIFMTRVSLTVKVQPLKCGGEMMCKLCGINLCV